MLFSLPSNRPPRAHFSGIGGTAMVAGARLAIEAGWEVRGSDNPLYPPTSHMVEVLGVPVATGYDGANLDWEPDVVILGNVLSRRNPEVEAALERKMHYVSLAEWLKDVVLRPRRPVVVCGTHGKTTTTAITAYLLDRCGLNPGYLVGGQPLDFANSARLGPAGVPFVIEGDEYDTAFFDKRAKFLHYLPEMAIVTSIEFDHGDIYADIDEIDRAFRYMLRQIPASGWLFVCADQSRAAALAEHAFCRTASYGFSANADWRGEYEPASNGTILTVYRGGKRWARLNMPMAGLHNLQNTLAGVAVAGTLGVSPEALVDAMPGFRGVKRRMEVFLETRGMTFVDDFAHHPTAIRETIDAARMRWPGRRLRVLFEPRSNTVVTNMFQTELGEAFAKADELWIGPIYRADTIPEATRLDRAQLASGLTASGVPARHTDDVADIVRGVVAGGADGDIVLIMSNGAFGGIYAKLREAFAEKGE